MSHSRLFSRLICFLLMSMVLIPLAVNTDAISMESYELCTYSMDYLHGKAGKDIKVNGVKCRYYEGKTMAEVYGIGRGDVVKYLEKNKMLYVSTPHSGSCETPPSVGPNGSLNCAGFVCHLLSGVVQNTSHPTAPWFWGSAYGCGTTFQLDYVCAKQIKCYVFNNYGSSANEKLMKSGLAEKGDILLYMVSHDTHSAVYWGKETVNDITYKHTIWQSNVWVMGNRLGVGYNSISEMKPDTHRGVVLVKVGNEAVKPTNVKAEASTSSPEKINLSWKGSANNSSYKILRSEDGGKYKEIGETQKLKYTDSTVVAGKSYSYKIKACSNDGTYATSSATKSITVKLLPPSNVKVSISSKDSKCINISWKSSPNCAKYRVLRSVNGSEFKIIATVTNNKFSDTTVDFGKSYTYKIKAVGVNGKFATSTKTESLKIVLPAPSQVIADNTVKKQITLSWTAVKYANRYIVYRIDANGNKKKVITTSKNTFTDTDVVRGKKYRYQIQPYIKDSSKNIWGTKSALTEYVKVK